MSGQLISIGIIVGLFLIIGLTLLLIVRPLDGPKRPH
jgi:hypothetical protein